MATGLARRQGTTTQAFPGSEATQETGLPMTTKTYMAKPDEITRQWRVVDLEDQVLGRAATEIATVLMGKHRPEYTPHVDTGDFVVVINAEKVKLTGLNKLAQRQIKRYSGYPGGQNTQPLGLILQRQPDKIVRDAVRRMLPKNKLGAAMIKKLKIYAGPDHPHQAQQPQPLEL
jgi:large subunit ribosomal protein L13